MELDGFKIQRTGKDGYLARVPVRGVVMEAGDEDVLVLECPNCDSSLAMLQEHTYDSLRDQWTRAGRTGPPLLTGQRAGCYAVRASFVPGTPALCPICGEKVGETGGLN
jgi:hypothetical protein